MDYSVIFPTCNRDKELARAMASLLKQTVPAREIIVIDQSDSDRTQVLIEGIEKEQAEAGGKVKLLYVHRQEKSSARARNRGIELAEGDIISFLDDDVVLFEDYYEVVLKRFASDPTVGGVGGGIIRNDAPRTWKWPLRKLLFRALLISDFKGGITPSGFGFPIHDGDVDREMEVECFCGSNMSFRRELVKANPFDTWFTGYSYREDVDFSYRISREAKLLLTPSARLEHLHSPSNRMKVRDAKAMEMANHFYVYKKLVRKSVINDVLFLYSAAGMIGIAAVELLSQRQPESLERIKGYASGLLSALR